MTQKERNELWNKVVTLVLNSLSFGEHYVLSEWANRKGFLTEGESEVTNKKGLKILKTIKETVSDKTLYKWKKELEGEA